jgi:hypothetical protein
MLVTDMIAMRTVGTVRVVGVRAAVKAVTGAGRGVDEDLLGGSRVGVEDDSEGTGTEEVPVLRSKEMCVVGVCARGLRISR